MNGENNIIKEPQSKVVIRFQDCDPFGHLNNSKYIEYFMNAREDHLIEFYNLNIYERGRKLNENWVVTKNQIAYIYPVFFMEEVVIRTRVIHFTENSILMEALMLDKEAKRLKSLIWTEFTYISLSNGKSAKHPDDVMQFLDSVIVKNNEINLSNFDERIKKIKSKL
jgi:acyl-CoA thioester hydrolase